jgi:thiol-disulfide isomerase/thioredoxin
MKLKICLLGFLCLFFKVEAQSNKSIFPLKVGDTIPNITLENVINYKAKSVSLSEFKDKLLILDFWSTTCGSCIAMFPDELSLQKRYRDRLQIMLVDSKNTRDTKDRIDRFFKAYHPSYKELASVIEDTLLSQYFPHQAVGYYIWIRNNVVLAMTDDRDLTLKNIDTFLAGKKAGVTPITEIPYDIEKPIFLDNNGGEAPGYLYRFILTSYKNGLHPSSKFIFDSNRLCKGLRFVNLPKGVLYATACPEFQNYDRNRVIFSISHPEDFSSDSISESWKQRNCFTYEATFPAVNQADALKTMRNDLEKVFQLHVDSVVRESFCFVITLEKKIKVKSVTTSVQPFDPQSETFVRNYPLSQLVGYLNSKSKLPFIDDSGYDGTIRMTLDYDDLSTGEILERLNKAGLMVTEEKRNLKFLVVSETTKGK